MAKNRDAMKRMESSARVATMGNTIEQGRLEKDRAMAQPRYPRKISRVDVNTRAAAPRKNKRSTRRG